MILFKLLRKFYQKKQYMLPRAQSSRAWLRELPTMESKHVSFSYDKPLIKIQPKTLTSTLQAPYQHHTFYLLSAGHLHKYLKKEEKKKILQIKVPKKN